MLSADIPPGMFVTCFYALLDPQSGRIQYANASHELPLLRRANGSVDELYATGMPLGLMPDSQYDERETTLAPGDSLPFWTDGLVEAHNPEREMFGLQRIQALVNDHAGGAALIDALIHDLKEFTGIGWKQEDDITLVTLQRARISLVVQCTIWHTGGYGMLSPSTIRGGYQG